MKNIKDGKYGTYQTENLPHNNPMKILMRFQPRVVGVKQVKEGSWNSG